MERLQKVIAASGLCSRRKAEDLIASGKVKVNGQVVTQLGTQVTKKDEVSVNNKAITKEELVYFLVNKPKKTICSLSDEHQRTTVMAGIVCPQRIFPVGRLDYDTTGVLLLTNDGELANKLIHPAFHLPKTYVMSISGILSASEIKLLEKGVLLDDKTMSLPAKAWITNKNFKSQTTQLELTIFEGRNHLVKRMLEGVGHTVTRLHRSSFTFLTCEGLAVGEYRKLKPFEVTQLKKLVKKEN